MTFTSVIANTFFRHCERSEAISTILAMQNKQYYIYIATNRINTVLYVGVTNNLIRRIFEHKEKLVPGFTEKYNINKLVYFEVFNNSLEAITREKQLKSGSRIKKINLIKTTNPNFEDLYPTII